MYSQKLAAAFSPGLPCVWLIHNGWEWKTNKQKHINTIFAGLSGDFLGTLLMCVFSPIRNDPKNTNKLLPPIQSRDNPPTLFMFMCTGSDHLGWEWNRRLKGPTPSKFTHISNRNVMEVTGKAKGRPEWLCVCSQVLPLRCRCAKNSHSSLALAGTSACSIFSVIEPTLLCRQPKHPHNLWGAVQLWGWGRNNPLII